MLSWSGDRESPSDPTSRPASGTRRSRSGCFLCRARKVKCDERWPSCLNCERLKLECPGHPGQNSGLAARALRSARRDAALTQAGTARHRVSKSCHACRLAKARCSGGDICTRCSRRNIGCSYSPGRMQQPQKSSASYAPAHDKTRSPTLVPTRLQKNQSSSQQSPDSVTDPISWLHTQQLPDKDRIIILVEEYFAHVHPLRCYGFVHKPSFMQRLDEEFETCCNDESLLHIVCALGAKFLALNYHSQFSPETILTAGNQWAKIAKARIFVDLDDLSLEKLMTAILLYDHDLRIGSYASAFMLSGVTARMSQALQLNLESSADILCNELDSTCPITNESKRRLMWSCYVMDSWLPCHSHNFSLGTACVTEMLDQGKVLGFISCEQTPSQPAQNMGIEAYFIRLVSSRKKVLRYVKHLDTSKPPWESDSEFLQLVTEFANWRRDLSQSLKWNSGAIYARKESSQLGALTLLWCTYHQTLCDLYRIGMPNLFHIRRHHKFPTAQQEFLDNCRRACFDNARELSKIIAEASRHGVKALSDTWLCIIAHDSTKVMLYFIKQNTRSPNALSVFEVEETTTLVKKNMEALMQMRSLVATAQHCYLSVLKMMIAAGLHPHLPHAPINEREPDENEEHSSTPGSPVQESPEAVLNPLAIYRMARTALHGKDSRGPTSNSPSTTNTNSSRTFQSRTHHQPHENHEQKQTQGPQKSQIDERTDMLPPFEVASVPIRPADSSSNFNAFPQFPPLGTVGSWDPSEMAIMNMIDERTAPWSVEYLTDGQSGVDPFLFPF
ncbi:hypothetical protein N7444_001196 [Penicillium canescens]|nr:hypothetical protein N7444_001196 [Penicillium canescens]